MSDPLAAFADPVREWFTSTFREATAPQRKGWPAIANGDHTLILAPTGTGKTLSAFLWALNRLAVEDVPEDPRPAHGCSTSRRCGRWPSMSKRIFGLRCRASALRRNGSARTCTRRRSAFERATPPLPTAVSSCVTRPTS